MTKQSYFDKFFLTWFGGKKSNQSQCSQQNLPEVKLNDKLFQIYKSIVPLTIRAKHTTTTINFMTENNLMKSNATNYKFQIY